MADDNILRVGAEFDVGPLIAGTQQAGASFDQLAARLKASGLSAEETASALTNLGVSEEEVAAATGAVAVATENAGNAMAGMGEKSALARVGLAEATGSVGAMTFGLARLAAMSETIGPLLQAAFTPIIAVALVEIVSQLGEKMYTLYQNVVNDKEEMDALNKIETTLTETTARLAKETENAYIAYLKSVDPIEAAREKLRSLSSETFEFKIDTKTLQKIPDVVTEAGLHYRSFVESLQNFPAAEIDQKLQTVATVIKLVQDRLAAPVLRGPLDRTELQGELTLLQSIQASMQQFADLNANQTKAAGADVGKVQEEQAKKAEEEAKKAAEAQMRIARENAAGQKKLAEDLAKAKIPEGANDLMVLGLPNEALFEDYYQKLGDDAMEAFKKIRDEGAVSANDLDVILLKDMGRMAEEWKKNAEKQAEASKKAYAEITKESEKVGRELTRDFSNAFDGVIRGTENVRFAFIKLGGDILLSMIHNLEQMLFKWIATEIEMTIIHATQKEAQVAITAAAGAQTKAIEGALTFSSLEKSAVKAAGGAYAAASDIPIIGPFIAPAAAAAAFAGVMAFGALASAEQGAIVPRNMPVNLHGGEMVLPARVSSAVQQMAAAGGGGGGTNISIHAMDAGSIRDFLHRNQRQFVSQVRGAIRNGRF